MFRPAEMKRMDLLVLERDMRRVTRELGDQGVLHLVEVVPEEAGTRVVRVGRQRPVGRPQELSCTRRPEPTLPYRITPQP